MVLEEVSAVPCPERILSMKKPTIALCMIVKASDDEAVLLNRCLKSVDGVFDEINITITGENEWCEKTAKSHGAKVSHFEWVNDFSKARNFNFAQATTDFVMWLDSDDIVRGAKNIRSVVETMHEGGVDCGVMNYLYDFDDYGRCTVKHLKTRIVKKGSVEWVGALHEDFHELRNIESRFIEDVEILHLTTEERAKQSSKRNTELALEEARKNPGDPRNTWLVANAFMSEGSHEKAKEKYEEFLKKSGSDEEKYLALLNIADITKDSSYCGRAIILRPTYPNAYHKAAEILYSENKKETAINLIEIGLQLPIPDKTIVVYNPRDYDYNPLMLLMRIYFEIGKIEKAVSIIGVLLKNYPDDKHLLEKKKLIDSELGEVLKVDQELKRLEAIEDKLELWLELGKLPDSLKEHPKICLFRNINFIKQKSSGKDLVYYCSYTDKIWNPDIAKTEGVGGSEEAVINLSKELVKHGWNVTVHKNQPVDIYLVRI